MCKDLLIYHLDLGGKAHLCGIIKGKYIKHRSALRQENVNCPNCIKAIENILKNNKKG